MLLVLMQMFSHLRALCSTCVNSDIGWEGAPEAHACGTNNGKSSITQQ